MVEKTYLFVPGNHPDRITKALDSEASAVIIDLEDSIALSEKESTRRSVAKKLEQINLTEKPIYIRVNDLNSEFWVDDVLLAAEFPHLGVMLPKAESKTDIEKVNHYLSIEQAIIPLIETATGVMCVYDIAHSATNVMRLAFGAIDYSLDIGVSLTPTGEELHYPRSVLVIASKAAGISSPIDTVYADIKNEEGLINEVKRAKQLGFFAKMCIHPAQLPIVNQLLLPTEKELKWARDVVMAFEDAEEKGIAAINLNGKMVDYPVYKQASQILGRIT